MNTQIPRHEGITKPVKDMRNSQAIKRWVAVGVIALSIVVGNAYAMENTRGFSTDSRIQEVSYQENNVVPLHCSTFINTQVIFGSNERIINIQGGDADGWTIDSKSIQVIPNVLNIKPTVMGSHTDLSVTTVDDSGKVRRYYFDLMSNKSALDKTKAMYALQFMYPDEQRAKLLRALNTKRLAKKSILNARANPAQYNWNYSFHGDRSIMPLHIFDDGRFTYLQLRANQPVPAIFAVNNRAGKESVVNYRREGSYMVIQQVSPEFTLRNGQYAVSSIFNNALIAHINRGE